MFKFLVALAIVVLFSPHAVYSYSNLNSSVKFNANDREIRRVHFIINDAVNVRGEINLLSFKPIDGDIPKPAEHYDREKHFGTWINKKNDHSCLDTRGKVLQRDSLSKVKLNSCRVIAGEWHDPYTNTLYRKAKDIQIDHVVALANAYRSGAFEWSDGKRCLYANYMGNDFHLLSVEGEENEKKLDYDPSKYMPPNNEFTCEYLKTWLKIKEIWSLRLTYKEASAILEYIEKEGCKREDFSIPASEIKSQKDYIQNNLNYCKQ